MSRPLIYPGDILLSKYLVERVLGSGGMGFVVAVRTTDSGERFAIKVMLPDATNHADTERRFLREARACMRLEGEHTLRVYDVGKLEDGSLYMRMEYLDGMDLKEHLAARGSLPVAEAIAYVLQACAGLAETHALGMVHRDIKPANLFLTRRLDGTAQVKVLDFGISKQPTHEVSLQLTGTGAMLGSPLYMSPEQMMQARDVDQRTDIWSMGVVIYELLTGSPPFKGETFTRIVQQVLHAEPKSLRSLQPQLPPELDTVVLRCLQKDPDQRFASIDELMVALRDVSTLAEQGAGGGNEVGGSLAFADTVLLPKRS